MVYKICSNEDPGMTFNLPMARSNLHSHTLVCGNVEKMYTWGKKKRKFKFLNTESLFVNKLI